MSVPLAVVEKVFVMGSLLNEIGVSAVALFPCVLQVRPAINGSGDARWLSIRSRAGGVIEAGGDGDSTEEDIEEGAHALFDWGRSVVVGVVGGV